jgi:hypothetical protein
MWASLYLDRKLCLLAKYYQYCSENFGSIKALPSMILGKESDFSLEVSLWVTTNRHLCRSAPNQFFVSSELVIIMSEVKITPGLIWSYRRIRNVYMLRMV